MSIKKAKSKWQRYMQAMSTAERLRERGTDKEYAFSEVNKALDSWWNVCEDMMKSCIIDGKEI